MNETFEEAGGQSRSGQMVWLEERTSRAEEGGSMQQRISMITLGVADLARSRRFYEALGWSGDSPDGDIVIFQAGGMIVGRWGATGSPPTAPSRTQGAGEE